MAQKVPFIVAALGKNVDPFMLHIYAAMAQQERAMISRRTKEALAAAKARGVRLGRQESADANRDAAAARDAELEPVLRELSHLSSRAAAAEIERRGLGRLSYKTIARARVRLGFDIDTLVRAGAIKPGAYVEGSLKLPSYDDELAIEFEVVGHQSPKQLASAAICHSRLLDWRTTPNRRQNLSHRVAPVVRRPAVVVRLPKRKPTGAQALSAAWSAPISITRRLSACLCFAARNRPRQGQAAGRQAPPEARR